MCGERWVNPLRDEASLKRSGNQKKKTRFAGLFFLTGLRPVLRLRRSTPSARRAEGAPPSQLDRPCAPPGVPCPTGSTLRLSTDSFDQTDRQYGRYTLQGRGTLG